MSHVVLTTFVAAGFANLGTEPTDTFREFGASTHLLCCECTDLCARAVQLDTADHHLRITFAQAGCRAVLAFLHAIKARLDALLVSSV